MPDLRRMQVLLTQLSSRVVFIAGPVTITPTLGAELLTNPGFTNWTGDNPNGFTVLGESGGNEITERDPAQGHADTKTTGGAANFYTAAGLVGILASPDPVTLNSWYRLSVDVTRLVAGDISWMDGSGAALGGGFTASDLRTRRLSTSNIGLKRLTGATDITVDNASIKAITFSTTFYTLSDAFVPRVIRAKVTRTANTQSGMAHYADENNVVIAYLDGVANVVLLKRVGGTYTQVATAAVTYSAGARLELDYDPSGKTYTVKYNGATVISAQSVTDAVFVTATGSRLFSTYELNSFTDAYASEAAA